MRTLCKILTAFLLCCLLGGCKDSHDGPTLAVFQNIVTFTGNGAHTANFEYQEINDSPIVRLSVSGQLNEKEVTPGTRLLMTYSLPDDVKYGQDCADVILRGLQKIYTGVVAPLPSPTDVAHLSPVGILSFYRSGGFINFTALMPEVEGRRYAIAADAATLPQERVHLYFFTFVDDEQPTYNSTQVGSIDISSIWNRPNVKSVVIHVNNTQNPNISEFTFTKP